MNEDFIFLRGTDPGAQDFANWIVDTYNEGKVWQEDHMSWNKPESICIFGIPGACGMIIDIIHHRKHEEPKAICHFIVVHKGLRGKGIAKEMISIAEKLANHQGIEFFGAYVQGNEGEFWKANGFPVEGNANFTVTQTKRCMVTEWEVTQ